MGCTVAMKPNDITFEQDLLKELFDYKDNHLIWKNRPPHLSRFIGKIAGSTHHSGYRGIKINNVIYPAHRLIWVYHYGTIDKDMEIDHINGVKDDNDIKNLRLVTTQENCYNRSRLNAKGYTWNKNMGKWQASIWLNNKMKYLGLFTIEDDARKAYLNEVNTFHIIQGDVL
jgi:hypothetical protein